MIHNLSKLQQLLCEFPFIESIMNAHYIPDDSSSLKSGTMDVRVERADGNLMCRSGYGAGVRDGFFLVHVRGRHANQVSQKAEYLFAVGRDNAIINSLMWFNCPLANEATEPPRCGRDIFIVDEIKDGEGRFISAETCYSQAKFLVWVTVEAFYASVSGSDHKESRFGEFLGRDVTITIYKEPEGGFEQLCHQSMDQQFMRLNEYMLKNDRPRRDYVLAKLVGRLEELVQQFEGDVLNCGLLRTALGDVVMANQFRGISLVAGRGEVALSCPESHLVLSVVEGRSPQVIRLGGTITQIRHLVKTATAAWNSVEGIQLGFRAVAVTATKE